MTDRAVPVGMRRDRCGFLVRDDPATAERYRAEGRWRGVTLADHARAAVAEDPDAPILLDGDRWWSRAAIFDGARRLGAALVRRGLVPGDVVSFQLPNWHEAAMINLATSLHGFVVNPIVPIQRDREVAFTLGDSRSKVIFIPAVFRRFDHAAMLSRIAPTLPHPVDVIVVRSEAPTAFATFESLIKDALPLALPTPDPAAVKMVMYTSGTTGRAKGVLHSHETLIAEVESIGRYWAIGASDVILMGSPVSHIAGTLWALELPWVARAAAVLMDVWNGETAAALIDRHRCTITSGATVFLQDLLAASAATGSDLASLRLFVCGGAPIPGDLVRRAYRAWPHCLTARVYGSTEASSVTYGTLTTRDVDRAADTDGMIRNWDVRIERIVDEEDGARALAGDGEILVRGPELCLGYTDPADTAEAFDAEGFFRTGDIGHIVDGDYLRITDRRKDLIIRGGENLSAREIEDALSTCPGVRAVAVVAMPCPRMGEKACAFVEPLDGETVGREAMIAHLLGHGFARQKLPEEWVMRDALPRTASGKIRKNELRDLAATIARAA